MSSHQQILESQISMIEKAMREAGLWSPTIPCWVQTYQEGTIPDIWQWMQYIYLPMRLKGIAPRDHYLAPIVEPYMRNSTYPNYILHLIIELDAITPAFQKLKIQSL